MNKRNCCTNFRICKKKPILIKPREGKTPDGEDSVCYQWNHFKDAWRVVDQPVYTRSILDYEIVVDPDTENWQDMRQETGKLVSYCKKNGIPCYMAYSGGKGIHTHIFLEERKPTDRIKSSNLDVDIAKETCKAVFNEIVKASGYDVKRAKTDMRKINFNRHNKGSQIRMVGSTRSGGFFKTLVNEIPEKRPTSKNTQPSLRFPKIKIPQSITFKTADTPFEKIIKKAIHGATISAEYKKEYKIENYDLSDTEIDQYPCMKQLLQEGLPQGRYYGAFGIACLCYDIGYNKSKTEKLVKKFLRKCQLTSEEQEIRLNNVMNDFGKYHFSCARFKEDFGESVCDWFECPLKKQKAQPKDTKTNGIDIDSMKALPEWDGENTIHNYLVYVKDLDGKPERFYTKTWVEDGVIKEQIVPQRSIPENTAPTHEYFKKEYDSMMSLFFEIKDTIEAHASFDSPSYSTLIALGVMASYFREVFNTYPYFDFISSEAGAGKTTAMMAMVNCSFYGTMTSTFTESVLFREIDDSHCVYGLDNLERLFTKPKDHAGVIDLLSSSYSKGIPCKRMEKVGDGFIVRYFDGYGIKIFTHLTDFPRSLNALKSRCIPIIMQKGIPKRKKISSETFTDIRDKLYKARLLENDNVKKLYTNVLDSERFTGRESDLFSPLLTIAKMVSDDVCRVVCDSAVATRDDRVEVDQWNVGLVTVLFNNKTTGEVAAQNIKDDLYIYLVDNNLISKEGKLHTKTVSSRLKKLGFKKSSKKTDNKTWFVIEGARVHQRALEYGIVNSRNDDELDKLVELEKLENQNGVSLTNSKKTTNEVTRELEKLEKLVKWGGIGEKKTDLSDLEKSIKNWESQNSQPLTQNKVTDFCIWYCKRNPERKLQPSDLKQTIEKMLKITPDRHTPSQDDLGTWIKDVNKTLHEDAKKVTFTKEAKAAYDKGDYVKALAYEVISIRYAELGKLCNIPAIEAKESKQVLNTVLSKIKDMKKK
ncbi:MAG: hypothetical protein DIAAKJNI_00529 [Candidatus Argoarchaeum ethanivorans]|uniref:Uncharacterized protein n=1 Tax=Candidatus Argoarchaeum ethanivorans TaxID=2608793 RepID=A0A811TD95_9EURY|nr:MAG: hypothetical protein DIAAKJNI_00529 [Candidatus Argoarchaeum ethanivorans]